MSPTIVSRIRLAMQVFLHGKVPMQSTRDQIPSISPEEVEEARLFFPRPKFFIFGHARSGTTLLARLVRLHPQVHCNWQAHFFTRPPLLKALVSDPEVGSWLTRRSNRWNRGRDLSPVVLRAASDFILERDALRLGKSIIGDKSPNSLLNGEAVRLLYAVYPDARLIFIVRDGRDAALSHRFQSFIDSPQHLSREDLRIREEYVRTPQPFFIGERSLFSEGGIRRAAEGWVHNVVETHQAGQELFGDSYISLRYEDVLAQPWTEMERIWRFIGANLPSEGLEQALADELQQNPDADWQQQKAGEIAQTMVKGKHGSWQAMFTARDRQIFTQVAVETLQTWGYPE